MHTLSSKLISIVFLAGLLTAANVANAATLRLGGTGSSIGMLKQVGGEFAAGSGGAVKAEVVGSLGSSGALRALIDGQLDLAVSARPLKPEEAAAGLRQVLVLRTPYVRRESPQYIYSHNSMWQYQQLRIEELIQLPEAGEQPFRQKVCAASRSTRSRSTSPSSMISRPRKTASPLCAPWSA